MMLNQNVFTKKKFLFLIKLKNKLLIIAFIAAIL